MTEKRFYSIGSSLYNNTQCISDKPIANFKSKDECKKVCELLNEQDKQIKELQQLIENMSDYIEKLGGWED